MAAELEMMTSTSALLGGAGTFTGTWFQTANFDRLLGTVTADVAGTAFVDYSAAGTLVDYTATSIPVTAGGTAAFEFSIFAPWARVRYTNGGAGQATFRLNCWGRNI